MPQDLADYLDELDDFIEREIKPLEQQDDNIRFFDHRREDARTDWDRGGLPNEEWEELLARGAAAGRRGRPLPLRRSRRSTAARTAPTSTWRSSASTSPRKGLGLHNDLQNEHSIVGNNVGLLLMIALRHRRAEGASGSTTSPTARAGFAFGITEPNHGSDATYMETTAVARRRRVGHQRREDVEHRHAQRARTTSIFARTSAASPATATGITAFLVPTDAPGLRDRRVPVDVQHADRPRPGHAAPTCGCRDGAIFGGEGRGLEVVQHFFHENRIRQAASSARRRAVLHQRVGRRTPSERKPFGKPLATNQAHPVPARRAADRRRRCCAR